MNTQLTHAQNNLPTPATVKPSATRVMIALSVCMALQVTGYVMIMPIFSQRFSELGAGVQALGTSSMVYALAATLVAPFLGALADRFGRRPLLLFSFAAYILAFTGYRLIESVPVLIVLRGLAGAFTAGLGPAVYGMVGDLAPTDQRARWIGIVNGGQSIGWIAGPILGGLIFDHYGFDVLLAVSITFAVATFATAFLTVKSSAIPAQAEAKQFSKALTTAKQPFMAGLRKSLPRAMPTFALLIAIYFVVMFAWAFIEPKFMFYAYDGLGWSASRLGMAMSFYGIAMAAGEFGLSQLSDRFGRKPVIIVGLALFSAQFIGLAFSHNDIVITASFALAGLGNAIYDPALSASILDMTPAGHQSRIMGIKTTAGSLGSILGPGLVVLFDSILSAQSIFAGAAGAVLLIILVTAAARMGSKPPSALTELTPASVTLENR